jgi:hypothetical protein
VVKAASQKPAGQWLLLPVTVCVTIDGKKAGEDSREGLGGERPTKDLGTKQQNWDLGEAKQQHQQQGHLGLVGVGKSGWKKGRLAGRL